MTGSRSKTSRRDRKESRERSLRAREHGLPEAPGLNKPARSRSSSGPEAGRRLDTIADPAQGEPWADSPSGKRGGWFERVPVSVKVLTAGILILVGIGLYRAYQQREAARFDIAPTPPSSSAVRHVP